MSTQLGIQVAPASPLALAFLHDMIVQIVGERSGIKETDLTMDILVDLNKRDEFFDPMTDEISTEMIFTEIQRMVNLGRIVGIDCQIGDGGYMFLVPAGTRLQIAIPIKYSGTRH